MERADFVVLQWLVLAVKVLKDKTSCVDSIPISRVDAIVFEAYLGDILDRVWSYTCPPVAIEQLEDVKLPQLVLGKPACSFSVVTLGDLEIRLD